MVEQEAGPERDPVKACRAIADKSVQLWLDQDDHTDDITIIVAFLFEDTEPTSPLASPTSKADTMGLGQVPYTSATGDWFSAELMKAAMGLSRPQRATRNKGKRSVSSLNHAISMRLGDDFDEAIAQNSVCPAVAGAGVPQKLIPRMMNSVRASILFADLDDATVMQMLNLMERRCYRRGDVVFNAGDQGDYFYVLDAGTFVAVVMPRGKLTKKEPQMHLYAKTPWGTYPSFGEMAVIGGGKGRPATVKAQTNGSLWLLHKDAYRWCLSQARSTEPNGSLEDDTSVLPAKQAAKAPDTVRELEAAISRSVLFQQLRLEQRRILIDAMAAETFSAGQIVYEQGQVGNTFYVVANGDFEVSVATESGRERVVHHYTGGDDAHHRRGEPWSMFGEQALLFRKPRGSTVRAKVESTVWTLRRGTFQALLKGMRPKGARGATGD